MQSMGDMAEQVAVSSGEVSKVSQSLAEGAMSQNESVQPRAMNFRRFLIH